MFLSSDARIVDALCRHPLFLEPFPVWIPKKCRFFEKSWKNVCKFGICRYLCIRVWEKPPVGTDRNTGDDRKCEKAGCETESDRKAENDDFSKNAKFLKKSLQDWKRWLIFAVLSHYKVRRFFNTVLWITGYIWEKKKCSIYLSNFLLRIIE